MTLEPHHAAARSWSDDETARIGVWLAGRHVAAAGSGASVTPTDAGSPVSVALRPPSAPVGADPGMPVAGFCGGRGGDNSPGPVVQDTPDDSDRLRAAQR